MAMKDSMTDKRSSSLWLQHMKMINILYKFIMAKQTGCCIYRWYTKCGLTISAYLYLQMMQELENSHSEVHRELIEIIHVIVRSDHCWVGQSSNLIIMQVLITGHLTQWWGMAETQRIERLLSTLACAEVNNATQELTGVQYTTSEQHKELAKDRQEHDLKDTANVLQFLTSWSPVSAMI